MSRACWAWHGRSASWRSASRTSTAVMPTSSRRSRSVSVSCTSGSRSSARVRMRSPRQALWRRSGSITRSGTGRSSRCRREARSRPSSRQRRSTGCATSRSCRWWAASRPTDPSWRARSSSVSWRLGSERRTAACTDRPCCTPTPRGTRCLPNRRSEGSSRGLGPPTSPWSASARSTQTGCEVLEGLGLTDAQQRALLSRNPIGTICCRFYDGDGQPISGIVHDRVLGVDLGRPPPHPDGDRSGDRSGQGAAVHAALRGGLIDGLITDAGLAHSVLSVEGVL